MSRDIILAKVRTALGKSGSASGRATVAGARIAAPPRHLKLSRVARPAGELPAILTGYLKGQGADVIETASSSDVPAAVATYLRERNLPCALRMGRDARLAAMAWGKAPSLVVGHGRAEAADAVCLSHALAGVAETGTLVLASGDDNPVTLAFLPETHLIVLARSDIVATYEDAWDKIRARHGKGAMPRTVNFVSGPSRTADIGGKIVIGAHGPRRLAVIVTGP